MFDWTTYTQNPNDVETWLRFERFLKSLQSFYSTSRSDFLADYFKDSRVIDIGAAGHMKKTTSKRETWEHGIIAKSAAYAVGVEINSELCAYYNREGYHFKCVDATSSADIGERFDKAFLGDIVEHVCNPVALLEFAKRHLEAGKGSILVSTPNPFSIKNVRARLLKYGRPFVLSNLEHVSWIGPSNANELARRSGLQFTKIYFPRIPVEFSASIFKSLVRKAVQASDMAELVQKEYIYEFRAA